MNELFSDALQILINLWNVHLSSVSKYGFLLVCKESHPSIHNPRPLFYFSSFHLFTCWMILSCNSVFQSNKCKYSNEDIVNVHFGTVDDLKSWGCLHGTYTCNWVLNTVFQVLWQSKSGTSGDNDVYWFYVKRHKFVLVFRGQFNRRIREIGRLSKSDICLRGFWYFSLLPEHLILYLASLRDLVMFLFAILQLEFFHRACGGDREDQN